MPPGAELPERRTPLPSGILSLPGAIAQLGERLLCKQEVTGSIPVGSIKDLQIGSFWRDALERWMRVDGSAHLLPICETPSKYGPLSTAGHASFGTGALIVDIQAPHP
jgi:hypothetical protein